MKDTTRRNLSQALNIEIERARGRASSTAELLQRDAKLLADDFKRISEYTADWESASSDTPSYELVMRVLRWQARLNEQQKAFGALISLKANHEEEILRGSDGGN